MTLQVDKQGTAEATNGPERGASADVCQPKSERAVEQSCALEQELLDPAAWQEGLEKYARAMHVAVALADANGRLLGSCHNPQPLWGFLSSRRLASAECPFAIALPRPCTCVAAALKKQTVVRTRDHTGLVHFAVPLTLDGQNVGALIAGQVFDQYPEQLALEYVAKRLDISPAKVWEKARLEHPVSRRMLKVYEDLLMTLGQSFLKNRHFILLEVSRSAELRRAEERLRKANEELERRVAERTIALEEAQQKALQAERLAAIGQVATGLAHEGRNALQNRQACLEMLTREVNNQPEALRLIARIEDSQDLLVRLFDQVREYAAPIRLQLQRYDIGAILQEAWRWTGQVRQGRDARFTVDSAGEDLFCDVDRLRLGQVFRNILENALQACSDPVVIDVACSRVDLAGRPALRLALRNNGPPLTSEEARHIFEAFFTTKTQGTGLGMSIAKRIVEAHAGQITVTQGMTAGMEVLITLPRTRD
jgi:signal transduction histidine kinase